MVIEKTNIEDVLVITPKVFNDERGYFYEVFNDKAFNEETYDGKQMERYSSLLQDAIRSIIEVKEERDVMSLFSAGETTALMGDVQGLDDFELICFF